MDDVEVDVAVMVNEGVLVLEGATTWMRATPDAPCPTASP